MDLIEMYMMVEIGDDGGIDDVKVSLPAVPRVGDTVTYRSTWGEYHDAVVTKVAWDSIPEDWGFPVTLTATRED
jgi:hypothetical protein